MSTAVATQDGQIRKLDKPSEASEVVTAADVQDAEKLARLVQELKSKVAELSGRWSPRTLYFADVVSAGSLATPQTHTFPHGFGGAVWWSVVRLTTGGTDFRLDLDASSTESVLVLKSYSAGTFSLRIEEAG